MVKYKELTNLIYQHLAWGPLYKKKDGRHKVLNIYLQNFIKNIDRSKKENLDLDKRLKKLGLH